MTNLFTTFADTAIGAASHITSSQMQNSLLEQSRTLAISGLQLMHAVQAAAGDPRKSKAHTEVDGAVEELSVRIAELSTFLERIDAEVLRLAGKILLRLYPIFVHIAVRAFPKNWWIA